MTFGIDPSLFPTLSRPSSALFFTLPQFRRHRDVFCCYFVFFCFTFTVHAHAFLSLSLSSAVNWGEEEGEATCLRNKLSLYAYSFATAVFSAIAAFFSLCDLRRPSLFVTRRVPGFRFWFIVWDSSNRTSHFSWHIPVFVLSPNEDVFLTWLTSQFQNNTFRLRLQRVFCEKCASTVKHFEFSIMRKHAYFDLNLDH